MQTKRSTIPHPSGDISVFERLMDVAYHALGIVTLDYATWMNEAEAAWIVVAGQGDSQ